MTLALATSSIAGFTDGCSTEKRAWEVPDRPLRPCNKPGCKALVPNGYCADHKQHQSQTYDRARTSSHDRGYDASWRATRLQALKRDQYLCRDCLQRGLVTPAVDVDHIIPVEQRPDLRLDLANLQSLCLPCHRAKTAAERSIKAGR